MSVLSQFIGGSSIKRIQRGTITVVGGALAASTATITLPFAVDPNKSVLTLLGTSTAQYPFLSNYVNRTAYLELTGSGTTLTASGATTGSLVSDVILSWQIVEYN